jgi:ComF family protein
MTWNEKERSPLDRDVLSRYERDMAWDDWIRAAGRGALDLLYPRVCLGCRRGLLGTDRHYLCASCEAHLPVFGPEACPKCGQGLGPAAPVEARCPDCRGRALAFDGAVALGPYRDRLRDLVLQLKLGGERVLAKDLGRLLAGRVAADPRAAGIDGIVPLPLHPETESRRGYNQAALLAEALARRLGRPADPRAMAKVRATAPQATLDAPRRAINLAGAYAVPRPERVAGRRILLVDDVMTTGATADEAARTLLGAGARGVLVAVVGR